MGANFDSGQTAHAKFKYTVYIDTDILGDNVLIEFKLMRTYKFLWFKFVLPASITYAWRFIEFNKENTIELPVIMPTVKKTTKYKPRIVIFAEPRIDLEKSNNTSTLYIFPTEYQVAGFEDIDTIAVAGIK